MESSSYRAFSLTPKINEEMTKFRVFRDDDVTSMFINVCVLVTFTVVLQILVLLSDQSMSRVIHLVPELIIMILSWLVFLLG